MKYFNMIIGKTCLIALMLIKLVIHLVSCVYNMPGIQYISTQSHGNSYTFYELANHTSLCDFC